MARSNVRSALCSPSPLILCSCQSAFQQQVVPGKPLLSAPIVVEAAHVHIGLQVWSDALLAHPVFLFCAFVVLGYRFLQAQHCRGREKAALVLLVCRARTTLRLVLLVLNKWSQRKKQRRRGEKPDREKRE